MPEIHHCNQTLRRKRDLDARNQINLVGELFIMRRRERTKVIVDRLHVQRSRFRMKNGSEDNEHAQQHIGRLFVIPLFTCSSAPATHKISNFCSTQLHRLFGDEIFRRGAVNGKKTVIEHV